MSSVSRYDVFLSHNSADKAAVEHLAQKLKEAGFAPFLDKWCLIPGDPWQEALEEALDVSATVAVFIGPSGVSPWHNEEMRAAIDQAVRTRDEYRVIPVLLPGAREAAVAGFLARRTWVDFRHGMEDAAAFVRLTAGIKGEAGEGGTFMLPDKPAPYRGLLPFEADDARFFFGRTADKQRVLEKLEHSAFVAVVGASGSGKSSLVKAGVLPALQAGSLPDSQKWQVLSFTPGSDPLRALANQAATLMLGEADRVKIADDVVQRLEERSDGLRTWITACLADRPGVVLLFVDQFEELFTHCQDGPEQCRRRSEQFVANLADAVRKGDGRIRILITLRADFLDRCLAFTALRELLEERQVLLGPMDEIALREAIVRPAQAVGAFFEKGLVGMILRDVAAEAGALPLLEQALYELWLARRGPWLTVEAYEASGGVQGALNRRADTVYKNLTPEQQIIARKLLERLITLGEGVEDTRRRANRHDLYLSNVNPGQVDAVLQALSGADARLVVTDDESVEVAHEALIQRWQTLRSWLEEDRDALRIQRRLTEAAKEWDENKRDESYLFEGARLAEAEEWTAEHAGELNRQENDFLKASLTLRDHQAAEREAQRQRELQAAQHLAREAEARRLAERRRVQWAATIGTIALILAILAGVFAFQSNENARRASDNARLAESEKAIAEANANLAATRESDAIRAEATAQANANLAATREAEAKTAQAEAEMAARRARAGELAVHAENAIANKPNDPSLALQLAIEAVTITWRTDRYVTPNAAHVLEHAIAVAPLSIITVTRQGSIDNVNSIAYDPNGKSLVTSGNDGVVHIWDVATGKELRQFTSHVGSVNSIAYSPDGKAIVTAGRDGTVHIWDVTTGKELRRFSGHGCGIYGICSVTSVAYNPDGQTLVTAGWDNIVRIWDVVSGQELRHLTPHTDRINSVAYSPDGKNIVTAGGIPGFESFSDFPRRGYGTVLIRDAATGQEIRQLIGHTDYVYSAAYSPDGQTIITASEDGTVRIWDVVTGKELRQLRGHTGLVKSAAYSPDGHTVITLGNDGTVCIWDLLMRQYLRKFTHVGPVNAALYSLDGQTIVIAGEDQTVLIRDATTGKQLRQLIGHTDAVNSAAYSPDNQIIATASEDRTARIWDAATGKQLRQLTGHTGSVNSAAYNPDGTTIVTASADETARIWDATTGKQLRQLIGHTDSVNSAAYSPDGQTIITASADQTARIWDAATGQELRRLIGHTDSVNSAAYSPDGTTIVTASDDKTARTWDAATGQELRQFTDDVELIRSATYGPDGKTIVTAGGYAIEGFTSSSLFRELLNKEGITHIWDVVTGQELRQLTGHTDFVNSAAYSRDGATIVTASADGTVRIWIGDFDHLLAEARRRIQRDPPLFTPEERRQYGLE